MEQTNQIQAWKESEEYQDLGYRQEAFDIWLEDQHNDTSLYDHDILDAIRAFEDAYQGEYGSELDYAYHLADELIPSNSPDFLVNYFDYESFARDLFIGDYWFQDGHVFWRH